MIELAKLEKKKDPSTHTPALVIIEVPVTFVISPDRIDNNRNTFLVSCDYFVVNSVRFINW